MNDLGDEDDLDDIDDIADFSDENSDTLEEKYEAQAHSRRQRSQSPTEKVNRLPIKLPSGKIKQLPHDPLRPTEEKEEEEEEEEESNESESDDDQQQQNHNDGEGDEIQRIYSSSFSRKTKFDHAKYQIATISQDILANPDENLNQIRKLQVLSNAKIIIGENKFNNENSIRKLSHLSISAIFVDIIPGYRIRKLSEKEKADKVTKEVAQRRDWEERFINYYQTWLGSLDKEVRKRSEISDVCLQCMCIMLEKASHFNFKVNLMEAIIGRISKLSWDNESQLCFQALENVLKDDNSGESSLEIIKLLNRMIKERKFNIHPNVLKLFNSLRLRDELTLEATKLPNKRERKNKDRKDHVHLSKKAKKALRENKEIEKEMKEAEAEVNKEQRDRNHTETLKLIFVIYFRILKFPDISPLLPVALEGVANFSHLVNIDFFTDLLDVLKSINNRAELSALVEDKINDKNELYATSETRLRLLSISTAFRLLTGQGEALNIDLDEFLTQLYALLLPLSISTTIEENSSDDNNNSKTKSKLKSAHEKSESELLFDTLNIVFLSSISSARNGPPGRSLAFAKRLLICSLQWPPNTVIKALEFIRKLIGLAGGSRLEGLLSTDDRVSGEGSYKPYLNDPHASNAQNALGFELSLLESSHYDQRVCKIANVLANYKR